MLYALGVGFFAKNKGRARLWAPLAFGFCLTLGAWSPGLLNDASKPWCSSPMPVFTGSTRLLAGFRTLLQGRGGAGVQGKRALSTRDDAIDLDALPASLRKGIAGPQLFVGASRWSRVRARSFSERKTREKRARIVARRRSAEVFELEYRAGERIRPETLRLPQRAELRVLVNASRRTQKELRGYSLSRGGLEVRAQRIGAGKLALKFRCDRRCALGRVKSSRLGWRVSVHYKSDARMSLR